MLLTSLFVIVLSLAAIGGGAWIWLHTRGRAHVLARILLALMPLSGAVAMLRTTGFMFIASRYDWNAGKLAPIVAMTRGYRLYQDPNAGVMTAWIYGPVPALLLLPAALAGTPTGAILIAEFVTVLLSLGPALWLILRSTPMRRARPFAWLAFLAFVWITTAHESVRRAVYMLGPDAPTLGLIACAIALLWRQPRTLVHMSIAAVCAVLACWCKQTALPVLLVLPLYLLLSRDWLAAATQAGLIAIAAVICSAAFMLAFGPANLWFHMVTLSSSHGLRGAAETGNFWALFAGVQTMLVDLAPTLATIAALLLVEHFLLPDPLGAGERGRWARRWFDRNPWVMLAAVAVLLVPSSVLGYVKIGGYVNNFSLTHYPLAILVAVLLTRLFERAILRDETAAAPAAAAPATAAPPTAAPSNAAPAAVPLTPLITALACLAALWPLVQQFFQKRAAEETFLVIAYPRDNEQELAYNFAKKNPGMCYFPWNNLSTLLAEGKLYHFAWGYVDREEAGRPASPEQIRRHLPEKMQVVGFGPRRQNEDTLKYLPPPQYRGTNDELPGFTMYLYTEPVQPGDDRAGGR